MPRENKKIVSKTSHIEIVHENPRAAADFLHDIFGAVQVEKQWSEYLANSLNIECIHMMFGGVVYQILKPINDKLLPTWDMQLKTQGPGIHNLSLQINGANKFREKLIERGVKEVNYWPKAIDLGAAGYSVDGLLDAYLFDATKECGFRFEFIESQPEWEPGEQE